MIVGGIYAYQKLKARKQAKAEEAKKDSAQHDKLVNAGQSTIDETGQKRRTSQSSSLHSPAQSSSPPFSPPPYTTMEGNLSASEHRTPMTEDNNNNPFLSPEERTSARFSSSSSRPSSLAQGQTPTEIPVRGKWVWVPEDMREQQLPLGPSSPPMAASHTIPSGYGQHLTVSSPTYAAPPPQIAELPAGVPGGSTSAVELPASMPARQRSTSDSSGRSRRSLDDARSTESMPREYRTADQSGYQRI